MPLNEFCRTELLVGEEGIAKLHNSKVIVFGIGGVGSFVVEALTRAGVGNLILVDNDTICISNINRQIHARQSTIGMIKVEAMKERVISINPNCNVEAKQVFITADNISEIIPSDVDYVVEIDAIGDPDGIAKGATRFTKNPKELLIAEYAAKIITHSPYYKEGFSFQTGTGGSSLAVTRFMREQMLKDGIKASFALGGITNAMVELLEEGLVEKIIDVQDFDHPSAISLGENANHYEIDANMYASPLSKGAVINQLDTAILSALEVDTDFNVNVITGSDGVIRGASGGHSDTSMACKMSLVIAPLVRGRIPTIVEQVNTVVTPGTSVDVVVTEVGIAINPKRTDLIDCFKTLDVPQFTLEELKDKAYNIVGTPEPIKYGDKVVALIEYRDGSLIDVVRNV